MPRTLAQLVFQKSLKRALDTFDFASNSSSSLLGESEQRSEGYTPAGVAQMEVNTEDASRLMDRVTPTEGETSQSPPQSSALSSKPFTRNSKIANNLRHKADALQKQIDQKLNPSCAKQNQTQRRARIAASMRADGLHLQRIQSVLYGLAELHEQDRFYDANSTWQAASKIRNKAQVSTLLYWDEMPPSFVSEDSVRIKKLGIYDNCDLAMLRDMLHGLIEGPSPEQLRQNKIQDLERELIGCKIPGFFPTPKPVIEKMIAAADMYRDNLSVLEPSAGKGDILDAVKEHATMRGIEITCVAVEKNYTLREILKAKGHFVSQCWDFEDCMPHHVNGDYERILMNPPFEKGQDINHVRHAYDFLRENGGVLVAIMSEGPFFRKTAQASSFRLWLDTVGGTSEKLEEGSFKGAESFRQTGVNTRMVVIRK